MQTEAYHLEVSKFSLYVGNNAGGFQPTNQNQGIFFSQIWNRQIEESCLNNGGHLQRACFIKPQKKDNWSHKPSWGSAVGSWYCQHGPQKGSGSFFWFIWVERGWWSSRCLSRVCFAPFMDSFVNAISDTFFDLFSERGKGKSYYKSALLHVWWQLFVHQARMSVKSLRRCHCRVRMLLFRECDFNLKSLRSIDLEYTEKNMSCFETKCKQRKSLCVWDGIIFLLAGIWNVANQNRFQLLKVYGSRT